MSTLKTLRELQEKTEKKGGNFLSLEPGQSVRIRFLQEVAMDGTEYTEERGTAQLIALHRNPLDFKKQAACSMEEEGQCWACDQVNSNDKESYKWKAKNHLLINVAVLEKDFTEKDVWVPKILDQTFYSKHIGGTVLEMAEEYGSIMRHPFKFKRTGKDLATEYTLLPLAEEAEPKELANVEVVDLSGFKAKPYVEQEDFYLSADKKEDEVDSTKKW